MLAYIQLLYEVEREARQGNLNPEQRRELRQTKSRPILEDIENYLQTEKPKVLPKSPIGEAIVEWPDRKLQTSARRAFWLSSGFIRAHQHSPKQPPR